MCYVLRLEEKEQDAADACGDHTDKDEVRMRQICFLSLRHEAMVQRKRVRHPITLQHFATAGRRGLRTAWCGSGV